MRGRRADPRRPGDEWRVGASQAGSRSPARAALIRFASEPAISALIPSLAIIGRWLGARLPVTAIWIAMDEKLAKPHSAKVTMATLRGLSVPAGRAPRSMKATNSLRTSLVPNSPPAVPASFQGTQIRNMIGWKIVPTIRWKLSSG